MALKISDLDGGKLAPGGAYPNGDVSDDPGGTRVNRKFTADLMQFAQRLMQDAAVTPNSLPENSTNGFQLMESLNTLIANPLNAFAEGVGAAGLFPVILSGMRVTGTTTINVTSGYFFYNGQLVAFTGGSVTPTGSNVAYVDIANGGLDGMPVATLTQEPSAIGFTSLLFPVSGLNPWITTSSLKSSINTLNTEMAIGAWQGLTFPSSSGIHWGEVSPNVARACIDGKGRVEIQAIISPTGIIGGDKTIAELPDTTMYPSQDLTFTCSMIDNSTGTRKFYSIKIATTGDITFEDGASITVNGVNSVLSLNLAFINQ